MTAEATAVPAAALPPLETTPQRRRTTRDWVFAALVLAVGGVLLGRYRHLMDGYELAIGIACIPLLIWLGWAWRPLQKLMLAVALLTWGGMAAYGGDIARADTSFWLKYFLSSQSAILWMCVLLFMSCAFYWLGMFVRNGGDALELLGSRLAWTGVALALAGTLLRWHESYLIGDGSFGHVPVSNLYEVFVMFCWMTALLHLHYEARYATRSMGAFIMLAVSAAVGFLLWYALVRQAGAIQPLIPALQSWWMKLHVPANFVGYGAFALAAMLGFAWLVKHQGYETRLLKLAPLWIFGVALCFVPVAFRAAKAGSSAGGSYWLGYTLVSVAIIGFIIYGRRRIAERLPALDVIEDVMYKSIAVGFAFFTIATVLGALWAADAWGSYWSWDPKETWALIVWLNYAAWLHMRLIKGLRGAVAAWWSLAGLVITTFAFIGVNMFLSGLHSYGSV